MNLPKSTQIRGRKIKIRWCDGAGGCYEYGKFPYIEVGRDAGDPFEVLIHEMMEICLMVNYVRYSGEEGNMPLLFCFTHDQLNSIAEEFAGMLRAAKLIP